MGLSNINRQPKMTRYLVQKRAFDARKLVVVDVGARYGAEKHWDVYDDQVAIIGFEPDEEECKNLNQKLNIKGHRYFPVALHKDRGYRTFYITQFEASAGFYKGDMTFWSRFPDKVNLAIKETVQMETTDFDSFAACHQIEYVDFMKLDTEGAELDILEGSVDYLKKGVLGAAIEVRFFDSSKQPTFSEVDSFMRGKGFRLFDLEVRRHAREALPEALDYRGSTTKRGQVLWADALYLRDGTAEIEAGNNGFNWTDNSILKLASLFEVYGLPDCAVELLGAAKRNGYLKDSDVEYLTDLLTPQFKGKDVTYSEYLQKLKAGETEKGVLLINALWKDFRMVAAYYLPAPVKKFIKKTLLRNRQTV